jgi:hypothetical protein
MEYSLAVIAAGLNLRSTRPPLPQGFLNFLFRGTASRLHCEVSSASLDGNGNQNPRPRCSLAIKALFVSRSVPSGV